MKVVTTYFASDGTKFNTEHGALKHEAILDGRPHECPRCYGYGTETISHEIDYGDLTIFQHSPITHRNENITCRTCNGRPYRKTPWIAITETTVVGYRNPQ